MEMLFGSYYKVSWVYRTVSIRRGEVCWLSDDPEFIFFEAITVVLNLLNAATL